MENENMENEFTVQAETEEWPEEEDTTPAEDDLASMSAGHDAGKVFVDRHIVEKLNLFVEEYRRNGYDEYFVDGFVRGIRDAFDNICWADDAVEDDDVEESGPTLHE